MTDKKPRIINRLISDDDGVIYAIIKDYVKKMGNSGYVLVPNQLIGNYVEIKLKVIR